MAQKNNPKKKDSRNIPQKSSQKLKKEEETDFQPGEKDFPIESISQGQLIQLISKKILARSHSGPLPAPEDYREYENILPGSADRILKMAEEITYAHTADIKRQTDIEDRNSFWGLIFAFVIVIIVLGISFFSLLKGLNLVGFGIIVAELASLVIAFVYQFKSKKNRDSKSKRFNSDDLLEEKESQD
jgi:uncharacterized membrane protein